MFKNTFYTEFRLSGTKETKNERNYIYNRMYDFASAAKDNSLMEIGLESGYFDTDQFEDGEEFYNGCYGYLNDSCLDDDYIAFYTETYTAPGVGFIDAMINAIVNDYNFNIDDGTLNFDKLAEDCKWEFTIQSADEDFFATNMDEVADSYCIWVLQSNEVLDGSIYEASEKIVKNVLIEALGKDEYNIDLGTLLEEYNNSDVSNDILIRKYDYIEDIEELEEMFC